MNNSTKTDRLDSERDFHNRRFTEETREHVQHFYRAVDHAHAEYKQRTLELAQGKDVLEYGCAKGENLIQLAPNCRSVTGIDISDVAIEKAKNSARDKGLTNTAFAAMDAEAMEFKDESFDLVFGSGILHHLILERSYSELSRVLRPGGKALFIEPLGHNPFINAFRNRTPEARTVDEHPLVKADFKLAEKYFSKVQTKFFGLTTLGAIPILKTPLGIPAVKVGKVMDIVLTKTPGLKWMSWFSIMEMQK